VYYRNSTKFLLDLSTAAKLGTSHFHFFLIDADNDEDEQNVDVRTNLIVYILRMLKAFIKPNEGYSRMPSSGNLRRVDLVRTDVSEEPTASIIRVKRIGELGTLAVTRNEARCEEILYTTYNFFVACFGCWLLLSFLARIFLSP
jgi:hypothetical protein